MRVPTWLLFTLAALALAFLVYALLTSGTENVGVYVPPETTATPLLR